ncbi:MAG TPA: response regulator [Rugosimonospora sp.]|nr:response regulator [Rugosimonospora sp.]
MATVLVVDDRATNREFARATLDLGGHLVLEAVGGREGLAVARERHPDVVLADVLMPGMDGYEFALHLRGSAETGDIPVLLYSANYRPDEAGPLAEAYGVTRVLAKSGDPGELLAAVEAALHDRPVPPRERCGTELVSRHLKAVNAKLLEKVHALDESEARFATIAELSPIGIVVGDLDMLARYVNPRLGQITGCTADDLLGTGWLRCVPADERTAVAATVPAPGAGIRCHGRIELPGGTRWLNVHIGQLSDSEQRPVGFVATVDDVTPMIEAEERRHAAEREREERERRRMVERFDSLARLCGGVAHDFNNLLNIIMSFTDFAAESVGAAAGMLLSPAEAKAIRDDLEQVGHASRRAAHLTHQLLTFGGREIVQPTVISVNALVEEVCGTIADTLGRHVTVAAELDPDLRDTKADAAQLSQVLVNLADNAREAMPEGGRLRWRTGNVTSTGDRVPPGEYVHIAVIDDGVGMPPEVVEHAIEPFFTTKPKGQGTGLGLATAYGVVRQAGGHLSLESQPGRGTTVHIYLPATDEARRGTDPQSTAHPATGQTILIAEDEDGMREVACRIVSNAGYRVLSASDGEEALAVLDRHGPVDALLTDVVMPRMNGPELVRALHQRFPHLPVLYMSGFAAPLMTAQGVPEPGAAVLGKPFTKAQLLEALRATLARHPEAAAHP